MDYRKIEKNFFSFEDSEVIETLVLRFSNIKLKRKMGDFKAGTFLDYAEIDFNYLTLSIGNDEIGSEFEVVFDLSLELGKKITTKFRRTI